MNSILTKTTYLTTYPGEPILHHNDQRQSLMNSIQYYDKYNIVGMMSLHQAHQKSFLAFRRKQGLRNYISSKCNVSSHGYNSVLREFALYMIYPNTT